MKNFTELREELDEILVEEFITEGELDQLANDLVVLDLDEETLDGVMNELILEIQIQKVKKVSPLEKAKRKKHAKEYYKRKKEIIKKKKKDPTYLRKLEQMAKLGKTPGGKEKTVRGGKGALERLKKAKAGLNNDFDPELNELNFIQRIKRSLAAKIASKKAQIKKEKTANKPPTPEKIKAALERFLRQKALAVADKAGEYADATAAQKEKIETKASNLLKKVRAKWEKKFKKDVTKKMKDAYREKVMAKNPEAVE